jgi:2,5-diketo-D-gluconate reductase A
MPTLGLGTWPMNDTQAAEAVNTALDIGYRLIDTAENYRNEVGVGEGIRRSQVRREDIFVTTKFNREWHSVKGARLACEASLKRLGLDYIDLLLIHWPNPDQDRYVDAFHGMVSLLDTGLVRAIGTSNFKPTHLQKLFDVGLVPHVNQIQLDPMHARDDIVAVHNAKGIITETWSPLGRGSALLSKPVIVDIAKRVGRTEAQVVLRWHVQQGFVPIPKSSDPTRLAENIALFDFSLTPADIAAISALHEPDPKMEDSDIFGH